MKQVLTQLILALLIPAVGYATDIIAAGSTDVSVIVRLYDTSLAPATGETFSSVDCYYRRDGAAAVDVTEVTGGGLTTHLDNSFTEIEDGVYEYDLPDAAVASGARGVTFCCEDSDGSHTDFVQGCERVVLQDPLPANFSDLAIASSTGEVSVDTLTSSALDDFFSVDSGTTTSSAVAGSVVSEISQKANVVSLSASALADFFADDSGTTYGSAVAGSVVKEIADNTSATVTAVSAAGAQDLFTVDSGETYASAVSGSVIKEIADNASGGGGSGGMCGSNLSAQRRTELYSAAGVTSSTVAGEYVNTPGDVGSYYLVIDATENSAGGVTVTVVTDEDGSGAGGTVHTVALTATGVTRVPLEDVSGQKVLGRFLRVELSSLTGDWDVTVTLESAPLR